MLAQHLADRDKEATVPGTDRREYESLVYCARNPERALACIEARFSRALPSPRSDVSLAKILAFKRKREGELLGYRERIDTLQQQLSNANEHSAHRAHGSRSGAGQGDAAPIEGRHAGLKGRIRREIRHPEQRKA